MKPLISVVMPVYNSEKFLDESISSILNQTLGDFELIIINDASIDNSLKIIKNYMKKDKRIKLINNEENLGTVKSRNVGLRTTQGKYVAIMDSDDISLIDRLRIQFNYFEKNKHIFLVGSSAIYIDENGKEIRRFKKYDDYKMLAWRLPQSCGIIHSSVMFRNTKEIFYNESYKSAHDYNFYLDLLEAEKNLTNLPQFLVKYRVHDNSISISKQKEQEMFANLTQKNHRSLKNKTNLFNRSIFSIKLLLFYLKNFNEKRIKN